MGDKGKACPAYAEDFDEVAGKEVPKTKHSAKTREKPQVRHERRESKVKAKSKSKRTSDSGYSTGAVITGSETSLSPPQSKVVAVTAVATTERPGRRKSIQASSRPPRSPSAHVNIPVRTRDMPAHYGVSNTPTTTSRPAPVVSQPVQPIPRRATAGSYGGRPVNFNTGPPLSTSAYYNTPPAVYPPPPTPSQHTYANYAPSPQVASYFPPQPPSRPLSARFDVGPRAAEIPRTGSALGIRESLRALPPPPQRTIANGTDAGYAYYDESLDGYTSDAASIRTPASRTSSRTASIRIPTRVEKAEREYQEMPPPPPPRPILRRPFTERPYTEKPYIEKPFAEKPFTEQLRSYIPDSMASSVYRSEGQSFRGPVYVEPAQSNRPGMKRHSVSYDLGDIGREFRVPRESERIRVETANNSRRRQSLYEQTTSGSGTSSEYEDKIREASKYQENVGGPSVPLTAEALKRQRAAGSNRSTKSSGSRDESDYRKSATTRTTRSGSNEDDENITIKVTGTAQVHVGGTRIECSEGGEIEIKRRESTRGGSERSNSEYGGGRFIDDRRSRVDRVEQLSQRSRSGAPVPRPTYSSISPRRGDGNWV